MSDINLLPLDSRENELKEWHKKQQEKSAIVVPLSNPQQKKIDTMENVPSFWVRIKNLFKDFKEKKSKKEMVINKKEESNTIEPKPEIPQHDFNFKIEPPRKVFYQEGNMINGQSKKIEETKPTEKQNEPIKTFAPVFKKVETKSTGMSPIRIEEEGKKTLEIKPSNKQEPKEENKEILGLNNPLGTSAGRGLDINLIPVGLEEKSSRQEKIKVLIFSATGILFFCLLIYGILFWQAGRLESRARSIDEEIAKTQNDVRALKENNKEMKKFTDSLKEVKRLMINHVYANKIFDFLEKNTLENVYYSEMHLDTDGYTISLIANAKDYRAMSEQILIFQSLVLKVDVTGVALEKQEDIGGSTEENKNKERMVTFNLTLKVKPDFFLKSLNNE